MDATGVSTLARKTSNPEPTADARPQQPLAVQVRGRPEWKKWVEELAKANRQSVAALVDSALARVARDVGFRKPPER